MLALAILGEFVLDVEAVLRGLVFVFVFVLLLLIKTDPLAPTPAGEGLYIILSNSIRPLNSPFPAGLTIFKLNTTSNPHPRPSPPPPALISPSNPPSE